MNTEYEESRSLSGYSRDQPLNLAAVSENRSPSYVPGSLVPWVQVYLVHTAKVEIVVVLRNPEWVTIYVVQEKQLDLLLH